MTAAILILIILETVPALCVYFDAQLPIGWLIALAISPLLLLAFWKKPTLKCSQRNFALVFTLALTCIIVMETNTVCAFAEIQYAPMYCAAGFAVAATLLGILLSFTTKRHFRLFALGVCCSVVACCIPPNSVVLASVTLGLVTLAASLVVAAAVVLNKRIAVAAKIVNVKNNAPQLLLRNLGFAATILNLFVVLTSTYLDAKGARISALCSNIVCTVTQFLLTFTYLRQPLDDISETKISYLLEKRTDIDAEATILQLKDKLRTSPDFGFAEWLKKIVTPLTGCKAVGLGKVTETTACFVCNHYEIYGPFITVTNFPKPFMPWTEYAMTDKNAIAKQLRNGIENISGTWVAKPIRRKIPHIIARPLHRFVQFARPIPIHRQGAENFAAMMRASVQALQTGDNLIIFPEKLPEGQNYKIGGIDKLQTGFVEVALEYKKTTGRDLAFYPMYIDKFGKKMIVGERVVFAADAPLHEEKLRITDELYNQLDGMYRQCQNGRKK